MHALELVELSGLVAEHAPTLVARPGCFLSARLIDYWSACRCRTERWHQKLPRLAGRGAALQSWEDLPQEVWSRSVPLLEEILASEVLVRVAAAVFRLHDLRHELDESWPIGQSTLANHAFARRRALAMLAVARQYGWPTSDRVNSLRQSCETWTDILLARLLHLGPLDDLQFDALRAAEFASDFREQRRIGTADQAWSILKTSLRLRFAGFDRRVSINPDLNADVASALLACFGPAMFDSFGLMRSHWLHRLQNFADDAELLIEQIDETEANHPRLGQRWEK